MAPGAYTPGWPVIAVKHILQMGDANTLQRLYAPVNNYAHMIKRRGIYEACSRI